MFSSIGSASFIAQQHMSSLTLTADKAVLRNDGEQVVYSKWPENTQTTIIKDPDLDKLTLILASCKEQLLVKSTAYKFIVAGVHSVLNPIRALPDIDPTLILSWWFATKVDSNSTNEMKVEVDQQPPSPDKDKQVAITLSRPRP